MPGERWQWRMTSCNGRTINSNHSTGIAPSISGKRIGARHGLWRIEKLGAARYRKRRGNSSALRSYKIKCT
jgi:hypothetical protein